MAGAAAKKAAAAKVSAGKTYQPIFLGINGLYLVGKFVFSSTSSYTIWSYLGIILLLGLNYFCYNNILESAGSNTSSSSSSDLAGGVWLDVIAIVWVVQMGTMVWSSAFYYILLVLPPWGGYKVYTTMKGGLPGVGSQNINDDDDNGEVSEELQKKRQKRSERRRQKRM